MSWLDSCLPYVSPALNTLAYVALMVMLVRECRSRDFWERTARGLVRGRREERAQAAPTIVAPQWWAPKARPER